MDYVADTVKTIEKLGGGRAEHPGLYYLLDLHLQLVVLQEFMEGAEKSFLYPEALEWISELIDGAYEHDGSGTEKNEFLHFGAAWNDDDFRKFTTPEWNDSYRQRIEDDIVAHASLTMEDVQELREKVVQLVNLRSGIFAALKALADCIKQDEISTERMADAPSRLLWFWSGFKKGLAELQRSEHLTHAVLAARETLTQIQNENAKRISFKHIPAKVCLRWQDYEGGRNGFAAAEERSRRDDSKFIPLENLAETEQPRLSDRIIAEAEINLAYDRANATEKSAMEKIRRREPRTPAERQAMHRFPEKPDKPRTKPNKSSKPPEK